MKLVRTTIMIASLALVASACGKKDDKGKKEEPAAKPVEKPAEKPPEPKPISSEEFAKKIQDCWAAFNAKDEAKFAACYGEKSVHEAADFTPPMSATGPQAVLATAKPFWAAFPDAKHSLELVLVDSDDTGHKAAVVFMLQGTNSGEFMGAPATNKTVSMRGAQFIEATPDGTLIRDTIYVDQATMAGQLGLNPQPHGALVEEIAETQVVIAANDENEAKLEELNKAGIEAFNAHEADKLMEAYADDAIFNYNGSPEGVVKGKKAIAKNLAEYFKMSSDVKSETANVIVAGDYVVTECVSSGTHDGKAMGMKPTNKQFKLRELDIVKVAEGKVAEFHIFANNMAWATQLGMMDQGGGDKPKQ